jgi:hypothetical protein
MGKIFVEDLSKGKECEQMTDYKVPVITKEMALRNAICDYIIIFGEKEDDHIEARKSINKIVDEIISLLKKGDN